LVVQGGHVIIPPAVGSRWPRLTGDRGGRPGLGSRGSLRQPDQHFCRAAVAVGIVGHSNKLHSFRLQCAILCAVKRKRGSLDDRHPAEQILAVFGLQRSLWRNTKFRTLPALSMPSTQ
jgi:hypothetical protein